MPLVGLQSVPFGQEEKVKGCALSHHALSQCLYTCV